MRQRLATSELFLRAQTDERLAALSGDGHTRAFAVLVERHRRVLLAHARGVVGAERCEDVLQQALFRAWRSLDEGTEVRHAQAWLHRIVHNTALTEVEHRRTDPDRLDENLAEPGSAASVAEQRLEVREVLQGLANLPQHQRLALLGTELEGRSRRQLADELGLSEGAVRQLVHRARTRVRAGIAVLVPFPLIERTMRSSGWLRSSGASGQMRPAAEIAGGSGVLAGGAVKLAAVVVAAGAVGGGAFLRVESGGHRQALARRPPRHVTAGSGPTVSPRGQTAASLALVPMHRSGAYTTTNAAKALGTHTRQSSVQAPPQQHRSQTVSDPRPVDHAGTESKPRGDSTPSNTVGGAPPKDSTQSHSGDGAPSQDSTQRSSSDGGSTTTTGDRSAPTTTTESTSTSTTDSGGTVSSPGTTTVQGDSPATTTTPITTTTDQVDTGPAAPTTTTDG